MRSGVYFIRCGGFVKIGMSMNIGKRMADLQMCNPYQLELLSYIPISDPAAQLLEESSWHRAWKRLHQRGEWFRLEQELTNAIEAQIRVGRALRVSMIAPLKPGEMFSPDRSLLPLAAIAAGVAGHITYHGLRKLRDRKADFPKVKGGSATRGWLYDSVEVRDYVLQRCARKEVR